MSKANTLFEQLARLGEAAYSEKRAAGPTPDDPGYLDGGKSTHPTATADNSSVEATTGEFSAEKDREMREQVPASVNDASEQGDRQSELQPPQGTRKTPLGGDAAVEDNYGDKHTDPGFVGGGQTTLPAKSDINGKYAQLSDTQLAERCKNLTDAFLADVVNGARISEEKLAAAAQPVTPPATSGEAAYQAGYDLAKSLGWSQKQAQDTVAAALLHTHQRYEELAVKVAGYLYAVQQKQAAEEPATDSGAGDADGAAASGPPPLPAGDLPGIGAEGGGAEGGGAGNVTEGDAVTQLLAALDELGLTPEQLLEALQQMPAGGGGAPPMPAGGGGAPPMPAGGGDPAGEAAAMSLAPVDGLKLAAMQGIAMRRNGRYAYKVAVDGSPARATRDAAKAVLRELLS